MDVSSLLHLTGGDFGLDDLKDVVGGDYTPEGGKDPADEPQAEAGSGQIAGIASAVGMALLGAASSYFAYQKKKLCFKIQGGQDPESGKGQPGTHSEPQA
ncbi:CD99 molecule [Aplochiton taeniatus]